MSNMVPMVTGVGSWKSKPNSTKRSNPMRNLRYTGVAKTLHWTIGWQLSVMLVLGWIMGHMCPLGP